MAVYYVDGVQYEAKILRLKRWKKAAVVRFYDYNNEEEVKFSDLVKIRKKPSKVQPVDNIKSISITTRISRKSKRDQ